MTSHATSAPHTQNASRDLTENLSFEMLKILTNYRTLTTIVHHPSTIVSPPSVSAHPPSQNRTPVKTRCS